MNISQSILLNGIKYLDADLSIYTKHFLGILSIIRILNEQEKVNTSYTHYKLLIFTNLCKMSLEFFYVVCEVYINKNE